MAFPKDIHLFCRVVDNFGDIGVCWRLARQLASEHRLGLTLWVDDLASFRKICSAIAPDRDMQTVQGVTVRRWHAHFDVPAPSEMADVVIEAFGCELPDAYVAAMAARERKPVWINLEYLSAEAWVESCHAMPSPHPSLPLTKYFFFPGFSARTGGLPAERRLAARRDAFQGDPQAAAAFLTQLGVRVPDAALVMSLFCYPSAPVGALFDAMRTDARPTVCLVPEGVAPDAVAAFLRQPPRAGASAARGALTVHVLPFVDQPDYDRLLWACDLNFVRGEDSFVRAQWAARPFVWHIYPQLEDAHLVKLDAFLAHYKNGMSPEPAAAVDAMWQAWNSGANGIETRWQAFKAVLPQLAEHACGWAGRVARHGDLASNLMQLVREFG